MRETGKEVLEMDLVFFTMQMDHDTRAIGPII